jgi:phage tail-like protein
MTVSHQASKQLMLDYLPAIYQETDLPGQVEFLKQFLRAFEKVMLGLKDELRPYPNDEDQESYDDIKGLGEEVARLHLFFDPWETSEDFLPWLASWAALSLREELSSQRKRKLLAHIIPLYRIRGTRKYLEEVLTLCVDVLVSVIDAEVPAMQVGTHSTVGDDTYLGGGAPHFFRVRLMAPKLNAEELERQSRMAHGVIELAKPAHTYYELDVVSPRMQVGVHSTVGFDTVLGTAAT